MNHGEEQRRPASEIIREAALLFATDPNANGLSERLCSLIDSLGGGIRAEYGAGTAGRRDGQHHVPVAFLEHRFGTLSIATAPARELDQAEREAVQTCAYYFAARLYDEQLRVRTERLEKIVAVDSLTGVANRYAFDQTLQSEWNRMRRDGKPLSVLLLDVDYFKGFNDSYGHVAGDTCLRAVAQAAASVLRRPGDLFARYGGEEFAAILPDTGSEGARFVAAEILSALESVNIPYESSSLGRVSASIGIAHCIPRDDNRSALVSAADQALYTAKKAGRNRFCMDGVTIDRPPVQLHRGGSLFGIPSVRTKFVGRARELTELAQLLDDYRLLTIAGPGGAGKTRIAVELAHLAAGRFSDGVFFVDLRAAADGERVEALVALALEPRFGRGAFDHLLEQLHEQRLLLILDNCEQVSGGAANAVNRLLDAGEELRVMTTTRAVLRVPGERVYRLSGLSPDDAFELLNSRVTISQTHAQDARRLVQRLDGLPLAIELAAGRLESTGAAAVLKQVEDRLGTLRAQAEDASGRARTVEGIVEWSYRLLSRNERYVLAALSVFRGGFTIGGAVALCEGEGLSEKEVRDYVAGLESKSLVERYDTMEQVRLRLLETTQVFAAERLRGEFAEPDVRMRHALWTTRFAEESAALFQTMPRRRWFAMMQIENENVRAALEWLLHGARDVEGFARLIEALQFWMPFIQAGIPEIRESIDEALAMEGPLPSSTRAALLLARADLLYFPDVERAWDDVRSALSILLATPGTTAAMYALELCMWCELCVTGTLAPSTFEPLLRAAQSAERAGWLRTAAQLYNAAAVALEKSGGAFKQNEPIYRRVLGLAGRIGDPSLQASVLGSLARGESERGAYDRAVPLILRAIALTEPAQEKRDVCAYFLVLARAEIRRRNFVSARLALRKAIELPTTPLFLMQFGGATFDTAALLAHAVGDAERAARLAAAGDEFSRRHSQHREPDDQGEIDELMQAVRAQLGDEAFMRERAAGTALTPDVALHEVSLV